MGVTVIAPATTTLLTTLARAKAELGMTDATSDTILTDMITRASSAIARETRRVFGRETVVETLDGSGSRLLGLARTPIVSITEVLEDSVVVPTADYSVEDAEAGAVYRADGWGASGGYRMWGTEAFSSGYILPGLSTLRYAVTYVAGYVLPSEASPTLPGSVEQACLETVKSWFGEMEGGDAVSAVQIGQLRVSYAASNSEQAAGLPSKALALLRNYRMGYR